MFKKTKKKNTYRGVGGGIPCCDLKASVTAAERNRLTAVDFIRGGVVAAVVVAVADEGGADAAAVVAGEFRVRVAGGEGAAPLVAVVAAVVRVVAGVAERDAAAVVAGELTARAGVEGCARTHGDTLLQTGLEMVTSDIDFIWNIVFFIFVGFLFFFYVQQIDIRHGMD